MTDDLKPVATSLRGHLIDDLFSGFLGQIKKQNRDNLTIQMNLYMNCKIQRLNLDDQLYEEFHGSIKP